MRRNHRCRWCFLQWAGPWGVAVALLTQGVAIAGAEETRPESALVAPLPAPTVIVALTPPRLSGADNTAGSGMRAFIDPATGQLREPTAEEAAALARRGLRASAMSTGPEVVRHANGMLSAELGDDYMTEVVVRRNADGSLSMACVPKPLTATVLYAPAKPRPAELEKE